MKFIIDQSDNEYDEDDNYMCPIEGSYQGEVSPYSPWLGFDPTKVWFIDIDSIEQLMELCEASCNPLIIRSARSDLRYSVADDVGFDNVDNIPCIEIYNGYRE